MNSPKVEPSKQSVLRQQAEQALQSRDDDWVQAQDLTGDEARRLVHELRVHQIELEMQNEALQESRIALELSQAKYFDLYELAPVGYFTISEKGIILEANLAGARILGMDRSQLIGKGMGGLILVADQACYYAQRNLLLTGQPAPACQVQMVDANGSIVHIHLESHMAGPATTAPPGADPQPPERTFHTTLTDVSSEVVIKTELREANARLETALVELKTSQRARHEQAQFATVGQMAAGIAHEFNNMLAAILLLTQLSLREIMGASPEKQLKIRANLKQAEAETLRAAGMVQSLLDYSRQANLQKGALDLVGFLADFSRSLQDALPNAICCTFSTQESDAVVWADARRLRQVMANLSTNAQLAMPDGGTLHMTLDRLTIAHPSAAPIPGMMAGPWARITLTDTGCGMTEKTLEHLYEPFFTTRAPLGAGLGLAQVQGIVTQHKGFVHITSQLGQGTIVLLYLPLADLAHPGQR